MSHGKDGRDVYREFTEAVNMRPDELERWLGTEQSKSSGQLKAGRTGGESVGHESGRRIVALLRRKRNELTERDVAHMRKVIGFVHRHLAQRPGGDVRETRWRYSLMNWGHDPLR